MFVSTSKYFDFCCLLVHTLFLLPLHYIFQSNVPTSQTTERNPKALDISTFDLEFEVDPLFQKTSAAFDEGGVEGLLLNHLCIRYAVPNWYSSHTHILWQSQVHYSMRLICIAYTCTCMNIMKHSSSLHEPHTQQKFCAIAFGTLAVMRLKYSSQRNSVWFLLRTVTFVECTFSTVCACFSAHSVKHMSYVFKSCPKNQACLNMLYMYNVTL